MWVKVYLEIAQWMHRKFVNGSFHFVLILSSMATSYSKSGCPICITWFPLSLRNLMRNTSISIDLSFGPLWGSASWKWIGLRLIEGTSLAKVKDICMHLTHSTGLNVLEKVHMASAPNGTWEKHNYDTHLSTNRKSFPSGRRIAPECM